MPEAFMIQFEYIARYILSALAFIILLRCVFSLFRLRPRRETMATLINLADDSEIPIDNWETSIGRSRTCDIALRKYATVSRFHAVLALRKDGWYIFDTESKTGVYVNGKEIHISQKIEDGDTISFGNVVMKFESNGYGKKEENDEAVEDFTNASRLVNLSDKSAYYLLNACIMGRDTTCNICLPMPDISAKHLKIYPAKDGWMLKDLDSKNGTKLNGEGVYGDVPLYDGDIISLGEYSFMFRE